MFKRKGFTLIELLAVIVIIGILIAIILPNTLRAIRQANSRQCASNIKAIDTACQMYYTSTGSWPPAGPLSGSVLDDVAYFPDEDGDGSPDLPECPFGVSYNLISVPGGGTRCDRTGHFDAPGSKWPTQHN